MHDPIQVRAHQHPTEHTHAHLHAANGRCLVCQCTQLGCYTGRGRVAEVVLVWGQEEVAGEGGNSEGAGADERG